MTHLTMMKKQLNLEQMQGIRGEIHQEQEEGAGMSDLVNKEVADEAQGLEDDEAPQMDSSDEYSYEDDDGGKQLEGRADMQDMTLKQLFLFSQLG